MDILNAVATLHGILFWHLFNTNIPILTQACPLTFLRPWQPPISPNSSYGTEIYHLNSINRNKKKIMIVKLILSLIRLE
jgi:hypothetical protein